MITIDQVSKLYLRSDSNKGGNLLGVVGFDQSWSTALGTPAFAAPSNLTLLDVGTLTLSDVMQVAFIDSEIIY